MPVFRADFGEKKLESALGSGEDKCFVKPSIGSQHRLSLSISDLLSGALGEVECR